MNVLVLGGAGIVGAYLVETAPLGIRVFLSYRRRIPTHREDCQILLVDCRDELSIRQALNRASPDVVINAVGLNGIDECQNDPQLAYESNVGSTRALVHALRGGSAKLVHLSTNAVYEGRRPPYCESSPRHPVNVYGATKRVSEDIVRSQAARGRIVRLSPLYGWSRGWSRSNALVWIVNSLRNGTRLNLCDDVWDTPLSAAYAAQVLWHTIQHEQQRDLNLGGGARVSRYQFGLAVAEAFGLDSGLITGVRSTFFENLAPRPVDSSLRSQWQEPFGPKASPALNEGLALMREREASGSDELVPGRLLESALAAI